MGVGVASRRELRDRQCERSHVSRCKRLARKQILILVGNMLRACLLGGEGCAHHASHTLCACGLNVVDTAHHRIYGVKHTTCAHSQTHSHPSVVGPSGVWILGRRKLFATIALHAEVVKNTATERDAELIDFLLLHVMNSSGQSTRIIIAIVTATAAFCQSQSLRLVIFMKLLL